MATRPPDYDMPPDDYRRIVYERLKRTLDYDTHGIARDYIVVALGIGLAIDWGDQFSRIASLHLLAIVVLFGAAYFWATLERSSAKRHVMRACYTALFEIPDDRDYWELQSNIKSLGNSAWDARYTEISGPQILEVKAVVKGGSVIVALASAFSIVLMLTTGFQMIHPFVCVLLLIGSAAFFAMSGMIKNKVY
jgi:hypothetical protein